MDSLELGNVKTNHSMRDKVRNIFEKAVEQFRHPHLLDKCKLLYRECNDDFLEEFKTALRCTLVYPDKEAADNILLFVSKLVILLYMIGGDDMDEYDTINEECTLPNQILELLFKSHGASNTTARVRCLQLLNKILSGMPENSTISDGIWIKLKETLLTRIQDKSPIVRVQAVMAARKLQDPKNLNCEIIKALVFHLTDPSSAVRRTVVSSIAFNKVTIGHVLARTRDVNDNVRRNTYLVFSKIRVLNLTIKYRLTILERGIQDRSDLVRSCVQSVLLVNWLDNFNKDVVKFLEALDVVNCPDTVLKIVEIVFKVLPMEDVIKSLPLDPDTRLIPGEKLTPEVALLWRAVSHYYWTQKNDEELEKILPNISMFCNYIRSLYPLDANKSLNLSHDEKWEEIKEKEVLSHLLELTKVFDFSDELGRANLKKLIFEMLSSQRIDNNAIECLMELVASVIPSTEVFLQEVTEVISEIREPLIVQTIPVSKRQQMEYEINISDLKVMLNDLKEKEYNAVADKDYTEAQALKVEIEKLEAELKSLNNKTCISQEVREEKNDPITVCKCLTILMHMIKYSKVTTLTPTLRNIKENFLNQCLTSQDLFTQSLSIQVLGQFCVLDMDMAKENLFRFILMLSENGDDEINSPALKSVFDILLYHGIKPFEKLHNCADDGPSNSEHGHNNSNDGEDDDDLFNLKPDVSNDGLDSKFIPVLVELLNCKSNDLLKKVAFEGLCKLLFSGVIYSPEILSKIVVKGFSPIIDNESEDYIRQVFMVFFPAFAATTPRGQEMIEAAFVPTLRRLIMAPLGTPEADINPRDVASFLIEYTLPNTNNQTQMVLHVHNNLAMSICHEILRECDQCAGTEVFQMYLKSLLQLKLSLDSVAFVNQIHVLINKIKKELNDRILCRILNEFKKKVDEGCHSTLTSVENTLTTTTSENNLESKELIDMEKPKSPDETTRECEGTDDIINTKNDESFGETTECLESSFDTPKRRNKHSNVIPESPDISD